MNPAVIGLIVIVILVVVGVIIYFSAQEEKTQPIVPPPIVTPKEDEDDEETEEKTPTFDIVNGWIHESKYQKMLKVATDGSLTVTGYSNTDSGAKWSFEKTDKDDQYYIVSSGGSVMPGKVIRITSSVIQTTASKDTTSRVVLNPSGTGYKLSDRTKKNFIKIQGSQILSAKEDDASVFEIEPSQFYISIEKTKPTAVSTVSGYEGNTTMVLSEHEIVCDNGGLSSLQLVKGSDNKYQYDYTCMKGIDTSGDIVSKVNTESDAERGQVRGLVGQSIDCGDKMIKSAQLLYQDLESPGKIAYSYSCIPTPLNTKLCETKTTKPSEISDNIDALTGSDAGLKCPPGKGITKIKYIASNGDADINYEYTCCPPA